MRRSTKMAALLAASVVSLTPFAAFGRVEADSGYSKTQTYNAALRYLRVDLGYDVTERDPDAAYLLFQYNLPGRKTETHGSIEIVQVRQTVKVIVQLPQLPSYHEQVLSEGLRRKLHDEYGEPPTAPAPDSKPKGETPRKPANGDAQKPEQKNPPDA
jgi:hypothetical protein